MHALFSIKQAKGTISGAIPAYLLRALSVVVNSWPPCLCSMTCDMQLYACHGLPIEQEVHNTSLFLSNEKWSGVEELNIVVAVVGVRSSCRHNIVHCYGCRQDAECWVLLNF